MSEYREIESAEESNEENEKIEAPKIANRKPKKALVVETSMDDSDDTPNIPPKPRGRPKKQDQSRASLGDGVEKQPRVKRERTQAQKLNFEKCIEVRRANIALKKEQKLLQQEAKIQEQEEKKQEVERKIVKKAICIKKKQIIREAVLDEISDDDIPTEIVQKIVKKQQQKKVVKEVKPVVPPAPKYTFV